MSLTTQFNTYFGSDIRHRGANYYYTGRVRIESASTSRIVAIVKGSERYRVELKREGRKIDATCACPYYQVDLCKHIWAVLLAAEKLQLLQGKGLELVHGGIGDDDFDGDFDDDEDSNEDQAFADHEEDVPENDVPESWRPLPLSKSAPQPARAAAPRPASNPKAPDWRKQMAGLIGTQASADSSWSEPWPPTRELLYVIDASAGVNGALHLEIMWRDLKMDGSWSKPKSRHLRREWQQQIPDVIDRPDPRVACRGEPGAWAWLLWLPVL